MKINFMLLIIIVCILTIPLLLLSGDDKKITMDALAQKLVNDCAKIHENDIVWVNGGVRNVELLEDIATYVRKNGAFPLVCLNSDRMNRRYYDEVDPKYDSQIPELDFKMATMVDAFISISYGEDQSLFADVPPERFVNLNDTYRPVSNVYLSRNVRSVYLGNSLYPTQDRAKMFDVPIDKLSKVFWDGVNVDYTKLEKIGELYRSALSAGKEVHISNPNGTNFKVKIEGRPVFVSDGVISKSDMKKGGAACQVWLPAGEVFLAPVPGTAEGKIVIDRLFYQGKEIKYLELIFKAGKLISMKAESGLKPLKEYYDVSGKGKDEFGFIDIGLNPNVQIIPNSKMVAWMASGMVIVGFGDNTWSGGENEANFSLPTFIPGSTLEVDGKVLVKDGKLNL